ncbi:MAG: cation-translocating P-type ATPase [Anaerolineaceae bacterium]|nr:cation-translocating P-type ATPase [Anaerolineaceae bacterium]
MQENPADSQNAPSDLNIKWHALAAEEVLEKLETPQKSGLTSEEVERRQHQYGLNELIEKARPSFLRMLFNQFNNFIILLLIIAAAISAVLGEWVDAGAIFAIVLLNALLGVVQERRAEEALTSLKKMAAPDAQVIRDGRRLTIPARELVPGDVVFLETGNHIPADIRLLDTVNLRVEEAALTGESLPVEKSAGLQLQEDVPLGDWKNTAFMGTVITYGRGKGVVVSTGMNTQLGLIANMLQSVEEEVTPLQQRLDSLGKLLGWGALIICGLVFVLGLIRADQITLETITGMFMVAISLAIAAVPEGLPAVVTITLAMGMREMVHRHALIRRLASVETLGSATIICTDKTGTLTQNKMTVTRLWADNHSFEITGNGHSPQGEFLLDNKRIDINNYRAAAHTLWVGVLNNDASLEDVSSEGGAAAYRMIGDPTEGSILIAAAKAGTAAPSLLEAYPRREEIPFDSARKRMLTLHSVQQPDPDDLSPFARLDGKQSYALTVKGAPDIVLNLCKQYVQMDGSLAPLDEPARQRILAANDAMTFDALRVLGLAYRVLPTRPSQVNSEVLEKDLVFAGMVGMIDPARPEVSPALKTAQQAGIRTIMITGDYPNTANAIAKTIGLLRPNGRLLTGGELTDMDDRTLQEAVVHTDVFARVSPEHKMRIVDALRANNQVVAMTGDGVNDAPAIKRADIGVAMGITGTDVAKQTADMVLTDDNYASIVSAIEQGRIIYSNIRKFVYYLLSCNLAEIAIIFLATLFTGRSPLAAIQILWLNLVTDGAPALALANEKGDPDIMKQPPRPPKEPIINRHMRIGIMVQTIAIAAVTLIAFYIGLSSGEHYEFAETMAFVTLSTSELLRAYTARSEYYSLFKIGVFSNKWMNIGVVVSLILILLIVYVPFLQPIFETTPLGWEQWLEILPLLVIPSLAAELTKAFFLSRRKNTAI